MSRGATVWLLLAVAAALGLRCPELAVRPMHNDEAVNAIKFRELWERGNYRFDPEEYHGPTLHYATLVVAKLTGAGAFEDFTEARLRLVTVLFGVGLILLLPLMADGLGRGGTVCAALLTALSPAMVFYSRYFIHEMLLVFFTALALAAGWRYTRSRKLGWALLAGAAVGLMQATKETFVFTLAAMAGALVLNALWNRQLAATPGAKFKLNLAHALTALAIWVAVWAMLFSSFFTNAPGLEDSVLTYTPWLHRTAGTSVHDHPWYDYLARLAWFRAGKGPAWSIITHPFAWPDAWFQASKGPVWSEGLILLLAAVGGVVAFTRPALTGANAGFLRFIAFYTVILTVIYSAIPYKTPWCLLSFWQGMILLAGVGTVALFRLTRRRWMRVALALILLAGSAHLAVEGWRASVTAWRPVDSARVYRTNPYVYSQTSPDVLRLVSEVEAIAKAGPDGYSTVVKIMSPEKNYWPLPWYLRRFRQTGWWEKPPADPLAPIMIVSASLHATYDSDQTRVMAGIFELRPNVFLELYVEINLWRAYLESRAPPPGL